MPLLSLFFVLFMILHGNFLHPASAEDYRDVTPGDVVHLPRDLYYRADHRLQWWYFTGHLSDGGGREFGYELTFFAVNVQQRHYRSRFGVNTIYISHFALSDISRKRYFFDDRADSGSFGFAGAADNELKVWVDGNRLTGGLDEMRLTASSGDASLNLRVRPEKPPVLHGEQGYSRKSEESPAVASLYFSFTRMDTEGTIRTGGREYQVRGTSWFDREISSRGLGESLKGWDWFSLQLDDGREIMLYLIRKKGGGIDRYSSGTLVRRDGSSRHLGSGDFSVDVLDRYTSKKTKARFPSSWRISIPSENLVLMVKPFLEDQEFVAARSTRNAYWEGAAKVEGTVSGRAYVELTGYEGR